MWLLGGRYFSRHQFVQVCVTPCLEAGAFSLNRFARIVVDSGPRSRSSRTSAVRPVGDPSIRQRAPGDMPADMSGVADGRLQRAGAC